MKIRNPKYPFKQCVPWENCPTCFEDFSLTPCTNCGNGFEDEYIEVPSELEQLTTRIAELEAEVERLSAAHVKACQANADSQAELAAAQLNNKLLREALEFLNARIVTMDLGGVVERAISLPASTEALDAYVAEKVKEIIESHAPEGRNVTNAQHVEMRHKFVEQIATLTRQRDLAVEALEDVRKELQQSNDRLYEEREIWDRVMGDGVKKLERLDLELDDCLYVLESLWDKTCNKEVTEKWAGILIRNKRGIGASSAEDSSEQTTA